VIRRRAFARRLVAVAAVVALIALLTTGAVAATAAGVAPWSNERLTLEVKRLKAQNHRQAVQIRALRGDVRNLQQDRDFLFLFFACNVAWHNGVGVSGDHAAGRADYCAELAELGR
jgi:hypothetical protein